MTKFLLKQKYLFILICAVLVIAATSLFSYGEKHLNVEESSMKTFVLNSENTEGVHDEAFYRKLINNPDHDFLILETDANIKFVSLKWREEFKYMDDDLLKKNFFQFVHPLDLPFIANSIITVIDYKKANENMGPFRVMNKDGEYRLFMAHVSPIFDDKEEKIIMIGLILHDISNPLGGIDEEKDLSDYDREELETLVTMVK